MPETNTAQNSPSKSPKLKKHLRNLALLLIGIAVAYAITTFLA
ncbi:hypothetical protein [Glutamicibacter mishrai]|nr:hypothetical protein [Glutamicibacter mishrai]